MPDDRKSLWSRRLIDGRPLGIRQRRERWGASGVRGVYPTPEGRWVARIRVAGRHCYLGTHDTKEQAAAAVAGKLRELRLEVPDAARVAGRAAAEGDAA